MTRSEGGYVIKKNGRKVLGTFYSTPLEEVIKSAKFISDADDEVEIYVEMILDGLEVIDFGDSNHVELKLVHTVGEEADEVVVDTPEAALTLALKLAIQAPSEEKAAICIEIASGIAEHMTVKQIGICKAAAECAVEYERTYQ